MCLAKKYPLFISPMDILPKALWFVSMHFSNFQTGFFLLLFHKWSPPVSFSVEHTVTQTAANGAIRH